MDQTFVSAWSFFLQGVVLGLAAAATPGAFQAYLITQSIIFGFRISSVIAFAPLISDPLVVIAVLMSINHLPESFLRIISFTGGIFVMYLAYGTFKRWRSSSIVYEDETQKRKGNIIRGAILNLLSPGLYLYWILVNGPLMISALRQSISHVLAFLIGFYGFLITGMLIIAALFAQTRRLGEKFVKIMLLFSTIVLAAFGILLIWRSL